MKLHFHPLTPLVRTFAKTLKRCCPDALNLLNPGVAEAEIKIFKNRYKQSLPETFYDFYRWCNGSAYESLEDDWLFPFEHGRSILPLESIGKEKYFSKFQNPLRNYPAGPSIAGTCSTACS